MSDSERSPRTVRLLTAVLLVATFAAGLLTGAGICYWTPDRQPPPPMLAPLPLRELDLTEEQKDRVFAIIEKRRPELETILDETYPKVREINEEIEKDVRKVLTPEQRTRLDELKARRPPPPRGGPPPGPPPHFSNMPPLGPPPGSSFPPPNHTPH